MARTMASGSPKASSSRSNPRAWLRHWARYKNVGRCRLQRHGGRAFTDFARCGQAGRPRRQFSLPRCSSTFSRRTGNIRGGRCKLGASLFSLERDGGTGAARSWCSCPRWLASLQAQLHERRPLRSPRPSADRRELLFGQRGAKEVLLASISRGAIREGLGSAAHGREGSSSLCAPQVAVGSGGKKCRLTPPSSGRSKGRFAPFGPPLMSNVRHQ